MHKIIFFPEKKIIKKNMCAYLTQNFQTRYPKHIYFSFGSMHVLWIGNDVLQIPIFNIRQCFTSII